MMRSLESVLSSVSNLSGDIPVELFISGLTLDSREIQSGMLFVALKGTQTHGLKYVLKAQQQGAVAVVWETDTSGEHESISDLEVLSIPIFEVPKLSDQLGDIAERFYQIKDKKGNTLSNYGLSIVGITGTDGKTSVSHFFAQAMNALGKKTAVIGTLGIGLPTNLHLATHTTPDVISVHKLLSRLALEGVKYVSMEVSSHALDQGRVNGVAFDVAVLTNLTRDHLDYHGTIEAYAQAKQKLFLRPELNNIVLNQNDVFSLEIIAQRGTIKSSGLILRYWVESENSGLGSDQKAELIASNVKFTLKGIEANLSFGPAQGKLQASVLGWFNLSNLLATLSAMLSLGVPFNDALKGLNQVTTVSGRMERIDTPPILSVVDYAHTPTALRSVLTALRGHTQQRIFCVFGCGGDRDCGKRPLMASVVEQGADIVIVTDDNPRTEDPKKIMSDIIAGFENYDQVTIEHNRAVAIRLALQQAKEGDVVLIAGKGHEQVQILADRTEPFDDREQVLKIFGEIVA